MTRASKTITRAKCRKRWGKDWYRCHPVMKRARIAWAEGVVDEHGVVHVTDGGEQYVV